MNLDKVAIPQADEQQRLLANLVLQMESSRMPLPRFWYLPRGDKAVVVMTGDDHGNGGTAGRFDEQIADSPAGCNVADWECVRSTSYVYPNTPLTDAQAAAYTSQGFEVGLHVTTDCGDWTPQSLANFYSDQLAAWHAAYPSLAGPVSSRTHCIVNSDYSTQPHVELANGIRLDTNYYYWPPAWLQDRPGLFTGSGYADAVRRSRRLRDRRVPGRDADDRRVRADLPPHDRHAARQRASARSATTACSPRTCTPTARSSSGADAIVVVGAGAQRAGRQRPPDARLGRRPQRLLVRLAVVEQPRPHLRRHGRRDRQTGCKRCCR